VVAKTLRGGPLMKHHVALVDPARFILLAIAIVALTGAVACRHYVPFSLTAEPSAEPKPSGVLLAGFARVDITPPPGAGLMGFGPEGFPATGHRQRLFARAMYLEDKAGERVAIVSLDLGEGSVVLHRRVAARLSDSLGIRADRLLLSATHTHSGPSHFFGVPGFDELGSAVSGYDAVLTDTLVARIARAVTAAYDSRQPARAAWGLTPVWNYTRIRSFPAYQQNNVAIRASLKSRFIPDIGLSPREAGVDPTFGMLRVDVWDPGLQKYRPGGAFSVFAIHGTAIPSGQTVYDSDLQGRIATLMEQYMDPTGPQYAPRAIQLLVNGGEGDVSPNVDPGTRCPTPRLVRNGAARGPRGANFETTWQIIPRDKNRDAECIPLSLRELERVASGIVGQATSLYDRLGGNLADDLPIHTAFTVIRSGHAVATSPRLCDPAAGVGALLGAEDGWTRFRWDWDILFSDSAMYPPNPSTKNLFGSNGCQGKKRTIPGAQSLAAGPHALPDHVQLTLVRLGPVALTFLPGEPTSNSAWTIRRATATVLSGPASSADSVLLVSLTNGYIQYVATPQEYALQFYEGSATIYGPQELLVLTNAFQSLAAEIMETHRVRVSPVTDTISAWSQKPKSIVHWDERPNRSAELQPWREITGKTSRNAVSLSWIGPSPSAFYTSEGPSVFFERRQQGAWRAVAWDNLPEVEVHVERQEPGLGKYVAIWRTDSPQPANLRIRLTYRGEQICHDMSTGVNDTC
jgi:neutral ceramidase